MKELTDIARACAVAAAAAHDLNNELTVILSSVNCALAAIGEEDESHALLLDLQAAAQRCVWKASGLLNFTARLSPGAVRASFEYLIEHEDC